jgi:hypothetical protein
VSDYLTFEGRIETLAWGKAVYTILPLPLAIASALAPAKRVEGEIADHPVNLAITHAPPVEGAFLWTGRTLLDRIGLAPGDVVEVRLRPAPDTEADTPDDITQALLAHGQMTAWQALTPGRRRGLIYKIDTAKTPQTRAKRIAALVAELGAQQA